MNPRKSFSLVIDSQFLQKGNLYLSGIIPVTKIENLQAVDVGAILSILERPIYQKYKLKSLFEHANIKSKVIIAQDNQYENLSKYFQQCYQFIQSNLKNSNVLVHCVAGVSRSATIILYYLIRSKKWKLQESMQFLKKKRQIICPNKSFLEQLLNSQYNNL